MVFEPMHAIVFRTVYSVACITGTGLAGVVKEHDPHIRIHLLQTIRHCIPDLLRQANCSGPLAFLIKSMLDLAMNRQKENVDTRLAALDILYDLFCGLQENGRDFLAGTVCALLSVVLGWAVESGGVVVKAARVLCTVIINAGIGRDGNDDETIGRIMVALGKLQSVRMDKVADEIAVLFHSNVHKSIQMAAMDTFITIAPMNHEIKELKFAMDLFKHKYGKEASLYLCQLVFIAMRLPIALDKANECVFNLIFDTIITGYHLNVKQPIVVAFDEIHLEDASLFEESFERAGRVKPSLADLPFNADCGLLMDALTVLSHKEGQLLDLLVESRFKGDVLESMKLLILYICLPQINLDSVCEFMVDFDQTVLSTESERTISVWLQAIHLFCHNHHRQLNFCQTGAILTLLLPKLFSSNHIHKQCVVRCLSQLATRVDTLKQLVLSYQEFLLDLAMQQLSSACLFPDGPKLLSALLLLLLPSSILFLEPFVFKMEELLEGGSFGNHKYAADLVECLVQGVKVCRQSEQITVKKAVCNQSQLTETSETAAQSHDLAERIVNRIFLAAVNLLSSDHEMVRRRVCELVEECCLFYSTNERDSFLPLLHKAWDRLVLRCNDEDVRVAKVACSSLIALIRFDGGFVRSRLSLDWIKKINNAHFINALIRSNVDMDLRTIEYLIDKFKHQIRDALMESSLFGDIAWFHYVVKPEL